MVRRTYSHDDSDDNLEQQRTVITGIQSDRRNNHATTNKRQFYGLVVAGVFVILVTITVAVTLTQVRLARSDSKQTDASTNDDTKTNSGHSPTQASNPTKAPTPQRATFAPTNADFDQLCNGLASLCDVRVNEYMFATLHNAVATKADGVAFLYNHERSLEDALVAGWRGLNFDVGKCPVAYPDQPVRLVHGTCALGTRDPVDVFTSIATFLSQRRNDVLLLPLQFDNSLGGVVTLTELYYLMDGVTLAEEGATGTSGGATTANTAPLLTSQLYQHPGRGTPWPTFRELIDADTRLLLFHYNSNESCDIEGATTATSNATTCPRGFHDWFVYATETEYAFDTVQSIADQTNASCALTRGTRGTRDFYGVNLFTTLPSTTNCEQLNEQSFLQEHLQDCSDYWASDTDGHTDGTGRQRRRSPSLVLTDCWNVGDVLSVVQESNARLVAPTRRTAEIALLLDGVTTNGGASAMSLPEQTVFLSTCSSYFASELASTSSLTNVYCRNITQFVVPQQRKLQELDRLTGTWQVSVLLQGDDHTGSDSVETADLEAIVESSSNRWTKSLTLRGGDSFATLSTISTVAGGDDDDDGTVVDSEPIARPTFAPTNATMTSLPSSQASIAQSESPTAVQTTLRPSNALIRPSSSPNTPDPTAAPSNAAGDETLMPTISSVSIPNTEQLCNGHATICDAAVNSVLFAAVHNAASTTADGVTLAPNHARNLSDALLAGYRGINVDIGKCDGQLRLVHGFCGLGSVDPNVAFASIVSFLRANPNEVILMPTQLNAESGGVVTLAEIDALLQNVTGFKDLMYDHSDITQPWPTLRDLIAADTRILFFFYNSEEQQCSSTDGANAGSASLCPTGFHDWFQFAGESQFQFNVPEQVLDDKPYSCEITRGANGLLQFYGVNMFTMLPSIESCTVLNSQGALSTHIEACSTLIGRPVNILMIDCWDIGDALAVVSAHNAAL